VALLACALAGGAGHAAKKPSSRPSEGPLTAWILTKDGKSEERTLRTNAISMTVDGENRRINLPDVLTLNSGDPPSAKETEQITEGLAALAGPDRKAWDPAEAQLTDLGLPVLTPLLNAYKDTDAHQPAPMYRLFPRIVPAYADTLDRTLDLVRLESGETLRGKLWPSAPSTVSGIFYGLQFKHVDGKEDTLRYSNIRRLSIRRAEVEREFDLDALRHCTQIEFLDTGVALTPDSKVEETARGFVRLAFGIDGWATGPDGLEKPGPNYTTNLVDGFPFGALVGRIGPDGPRWLAGRHAEKSGLGHGKLYFAVNDNPHWQNNLGSYRVKLRATDAYDLGDPQ
jgi:hypothetical protein